MAITGQLHDIPFADVLMLGARNCGVLEVSNLADGGSLWMEMSFGFLHSCRSNDVTLRDERQVRSRLIEVIGSNEGDFLFTRQTEFVENDRLQLNVEELLMSSLHCLDELIAFADRLPEANAPYQLGARNINFDSDEYAVINAGFDFWKSGATARALAAEMGLGTVFVRLLLLRLIGKGAIVPFQQVQEEAAAPSQDSSQKGIFQREAGIPLARKVEDKAALKNNGNGTGRSRRALDRQNGRVGRYDSRLLSGVLDRLRTDLRQTTQ